MKRLVGFPAISLLLVLAGCNQHIGPTHQALREDLGEQVYSLVSDFEIESTENLGSETEPIIQSRYRAILRFNTADIKNPTVLAEMKKLDRINKDFVEIHGLSTSKRKGSKWETKFTIEERKNLLKK